MTSILGKGFGVLILLAVVASMLVGPALEQAGTAIGNELSRPVSSVSQPQTSDQGEIEVILIDWDDLPDSIKEAPFFSVDHSDSVGVIAGLIARTGFNKILQKTGDGMSSGSIRIYVGIEGDTAHIAMIHVVNGYMSFAVVSGPLYTGAGNPPAGFVSLGDGNFVYPKEMAWTSAWHMTDEIGRDAKPESSWLTVDQGWDRWEKIQQRYNLVTEIASFPLPPSPFY